MYRKLFAIPVLLLTQIVSAGTFEANGVSFEPPEGFSSPKEYKFSPTQTVFVFTKRDQASQQTTEISLFTLELDPMMQSPLGSDTAFASDECMAEYAKRRMTKRPSLRLESTSRVMIDGLAAARAKWSDTWAGKEIGRTSYCIVVGSRTVFFDVREIESASKQDATEATTAVEKAKLRPTSAAPQG